MAKQLHDPWVPGDDISAERLQSLTDAAKGDRSDTGGSSTGDSAGNRANHTPPAIPVLSAVWVRIDYPMDYGIAQYGGTAGTNAWSFGAAFADRGRDGRGNGKYLGAIVRARAYDDVRRPVGIPEFNTGGNAANPIGYFPDGYQPVNAFSPLCVVMNLKEWKAPCYHGLLTPGSVASPVQQQYNMYPGIVIGLTPDDPAVPTTGANSVPQALRSIPIVLVSDTPYAPCVVQLFTEPSWSSVNEVGVYYGNMCGGPPTPDESVAGSKSWPASDITYGFESSANIATHSEPADTKLINLDQSGIVHRLPSGYTWADVVPHECGYPSSNPDTTREGYGRLVFGLRIGHVRSNDTGNTTFQNLVVAQFGVILKNGLTLPSLTTVPASFADLAAVRTYLASAKTTMDATGAAFILQLQTVGLMRRGGGQNPT